MMALMTTMTTVLGVMAGTLAMTFASYSVPKASDVK